MLLSYPGTSLAVKAARVAVSGLVAISYPLMCKPGRDSFLSLLRSSARPEWRAAADTPTAFKLFTCSFLGLSYMVAALVVDVPNALNLILFLLGATCSTVIAFVVPTLVYVKLHAEPHPKRTLVLAVLGYGLVSMPFCIAATFM